MKHFLCFLALVTLLAARVRGGQPNILLLMPDQWRWDWDGLSHTNAGKAPPIHLPNIERLRRLGVTFPRGGVVLDHHPGVLARAQAEAGGCGGHVCSEMSGRRMRASR